MGSKKRTVVLQTRARSSLSSSSVVAEVLVFTWQATSVGSVDMQEGKLPKALDTVPENETATTCIRLAAAASFTTDAVPFTWQATSVEPVDGAGWKAQVGNRNMQNQCVAFSEYFSSCERMWNLWRCRRNEKLRPVESDPFS